MSKTVFEIVEDHIMENGFDGLFNDCLCGCRLGDLMPCDSNCSNCEPAYLFNCQNCRKSGTCESQQDGVADFMMSPDRRYCIPDYQEGKQ